MATTPINSLPSPTTASPNSPPIHFDALNAVLDSRLNARYATTAARDAAITTPVNGMQCWCDSPGAFYDYGEGRWNRRNAASPGPLCKAVRISNVGSGGVKYAAPAGAGGTGYYELGRTPTVFVPAGYTVEVAADVDWVNGAGVVGVEPRFERTPVSGGGTNGASAYRSFFIGGGTADSILPVYQVLEDQITVSGTYYWIYAARTDTAGNTAGIAQDAWAYMHLSLKGLTPAV